MEHSVVLVKPDGVQRGLVGEIIHRFEQKGLKLVGLKMTVLDDSLLDKWYAHHKDKSFFGKLKTYMKSYPVVAMLWEGVEAVAVIRQMTGVTLGRQAAPDTIRGDLSMSQQFNLVHASESRDTAQKEENLLFSPTEIFKWEKLDRSQIYTEEELG